MKKFDRKPVLGHWKGVETETVRGNEAWGRLGAPSWRRLLFLFSVWVSDSLCAWLEPSFARAAF